MRILIADDDPVTCEILRRGIQARTPYSVEVVRDGASALATFGASGPYDVLLLDWMMPEVTGLDVCRQIRAANLRPQPYVALVTAKNLREEILQGLAAGADDFISKPIVTDVLIGRLAAAARRMATSRAPDSTVVDAIVAAAEHGDGELVVASNDVSARILFHGGRIAWVHLFDHPDGLLELLHDDASLSSDDIREVIAECRRTGSRITDTLLAFGLVDRATLRVSLLRWMQRQSAAILGLPDARTLFLPKKRRCAEELLFTIEELFPNPAPVSPRPTGSIPPPGPRALLSNPPDGSGTVAEFLNTIVSRCMQGEGVLSVAILDRETGALVSQRGSVLNEDVVWTQLHSLNLLERKEKVTDVIVATESHFHLLRIITPERKHLVYVVADAQTVTLAMLRINLQTTLYVAQEPAPHA